MLALRLSFLLFVLIASSYACSDEGSQPPSAISVSFASSAGRSMPQPKVLVAYEISEDCRVLNLRTIVDDRVFETQDISSFFTEKRVFAYIDEVRKPLRDRTVVLIGKRYEGKQLRCLVDAMNNVTAASIEEESSGYTVSKDRNNLDLSDGHLPDFGTVSGKGNVEGVCAH
jgi:hypothetical protein